MEIAGIGHSVERLPENVRPNMYDLMAGKDATAKAYKEAGITAADVDLAEVHDCFTINQIMSTEALGLLRRRPRPATTTWTAGSPGTTRSPSTSPAA